VVRLGPRCPVETTNAPCGDEPAVGATVTVARGRPIGSGAAGTVVARATTDASGRFRVSLRPGTYVVTADAGRSCTPASVRVAPTVVARVHLACDTGIR